MTAIADASRFALLSGEAGFDPIEERLRTNVRTSVEAAFEEEQARFPGGLRDDRGEILSPRASRTAAHRRVRDGNGAGAARPGRGRHRQGHRMAIEGAAPSSAADQEGRGPDRRGPSRRHRHPARQARLAGCSRAPSARTWSAAPGARRGWTGTPGVPAVWPMRYRPRSPALPDRSRSRGHSSTAPGSGPGWIGRPRTSRCRPPSACGGMARRCCFPSETWVAEARQSGAGSSRISMPAARSGPNW